MVPLLAGSNWGNSLEVEGFQSGPDTDTLASFNKIGSGYFRTLGVPLIVGREFTREDAANGALVTVVNEQFTRKFNLGRNALGKHIQQGGRTSPQIEIVGVVADAKYSEVKDAPPPQFFTPYRQGETMGFLNFYVKTSLPPEQILPTIAKVVARLDPNLPVEQAPDVGGADSRQRLPRSAAHGALGVLRGAGDAARGRGPVRSPGLHGGATDA